MAQIIMTTKARHKQTTLTKRNKARRWKLKNAACGRLENLSHRLKHPMYVEVFVTVRHSGVKCSFVHSLDILYVVPLSISLSGGSAKEILHTADTVSVCWFHFAFFFFFFACGSFKSGNACVFIGTWKKKRNGKEAWHCFFFSFGERDT